MDFELRKLTLASAATASADMLLVLAPANFRPGRDPLSRLIATARAGGHLPAQADATGALHLFAPINVRAPRVVLASVGDAQPRQLRDAVWAAWSHLRDAPGKTLLVVFAAADGQPQPGDWAGGALLALASASYRYAATKSQPDAATATQKGSGLRKIVLGVGDPAAHKARFARAQATAEGIAFAREWANRPANHATPALLAQAAQTLAGKRERIDCQVLGPKEVAKLGMGAFQAVAQGSREELRFIVLTYRGAAKSQPPVALVGKGITFDSGGISIKPAAEMDEMKFDMSGAASVLGVFRALRALQPAINVVGLIPACENLPDGRAVKPGDVVTSMSGRTIEILNTDAEGRLVLCDALTYAQRYKPRAIIDIATLTGACVIALGAVRSGLFSADDDLAGALLRAGEAALDGCWRMPLDDDYADALKTSFADVANVGGRPAGAITAAKFLQPFAGPTPWAHLDIAGTAWVGGKAKGATGRPVGLLLGYLLDAAAAANAPTRETARRGKAK
ncbi:MAG: leucyl aminopeptidase [Burkholderiaceae bacterium]|jgi:leucyl aminopeptidase|nr:leucyl aminopeptidase [Burkholderiaceae bacterium]